MLPVAKPVIVMHVRIVNIVRTVHRTEVPVVCADKLLPFCKHAHRTVIKIMERHQVISMLVFS
jgi:hypothetical protein